MRVVSAQTQVMLRCSVCGTVWRQDGFGLTCVACINCVRFSVSITKSSTACKLHLSNTPRAQHAAALYPSYCMYTKHSGRTLHISQGQCCRLGVWEATAGCKSELAATESPPLVHTIQSLLLWLSPPSVILPSCGLMFDIHK